MKELSFTPFLFLACWHYPDGGFNYHAHQHREYFVMLQIECFCDITIDVSALYGKLDLRLGFSRLTFGIAQLSYKSRLVSTFSPSLCEIGTDRT